MLAAERRRLGYRRLHILLRREGAEVNWKKLYRVYREERLTVRKRAAVSGLWGPERRWRSRRGRTSGGAFDFVSDTLVDGRRFRILCVIDDYSRECLAVIVDNSLSGQRVARELDAIAEQRGYPCMVVSDTVRDGLIWGIARASSLAWSRPAGER